MSAGRIFEASLRQDVCLVCSSRLSARTLSQLQRRHLSASPSCHKPPGEAVADRASDVQESVSTAGIGRDRPPLSRFGGRDSPREPPRRATFGRDKTSAASVDADFAKERAIFDRSTNQSPQRPPRDQAKHSGPNDRGRASVSSWDSPQKPFAENHVNKFPGARKVSLKPWLTREPDNDKPNWSKLKPRNPLGASQVEPSNASNQATHERVTGSVSWRNPGVEDTNWKSHSQDRGFVSLQKDAPKDGPTQPSWARPARTLGPRTSNARPASEHTQAAPQPRQHLDKHEPASRRHSRFDGPENDMPAARARGPPRDTYDAAPRRRQKDNRRAEKFASFDDEEEPDQHYVSKKEMKAQRKKKELADKASNPATPILLPPFMTVNSLVSALHVDADRFMAKLEELGYEDMTMDHVLNAENAGLIAMEYNFEPIIDRGEDEDLHPRPPVEDKSTLPERPPIITIMGHVDHGKTTLLDYLRKSSVAASEHGGITQHIGAFSVPLASGKTITFLDTPGHSAFLNMRQRGANVTDIVILVVAADDSVKPQTIEAIKHAKAARVPVIVAINKIDKDDADATRVKQDLMRYEVEVEDFGGDVQAVEVSGKTGQGMGELEESASVLAETLDLRAEEVGPVEGWVLEATTKKSGRVATVLVHRGTLRAGDIVVAGHTWARVRTLHNEAGDVVDAAGPGFPVEVDGWRDQPAAGDQVLQAPSEQMATSVVDFRAELAERLRSAGDIEAINEARRLHDSQREAAATAQEATSPADDTALTPKPQKPEHKELYLIVKADVSGSAEAVAGSIAGLPLGNQPVSLHFLRTGVGALSESDVAHLAGVPAGQGYIVNFNQPVPGAMATLAERAGLPVIDESIIYKVIDRMTGFVEEHLPPVVKHKVSGEAEGAAVFEVRGSAHGLAKTQTAKVLGCRVRNGVIARGALVKVFRGDVGDEGAVVFEGTIGSLRHGKKDVESMRKGSECGVMFARGWDGFREGDVLQCVEETRERRRLG